MGVVSYLTVDGAIISETRSGVERDYVPDALGSTVALLDLSQNQTDTFAYWPYGEVQARTGSQPTPMQFIGTRGYHREIGQTCYVRSRFCRTDLGRWLTVDPASWGLAEDQTYQYGHDSPTSFLAETGHLSSRSTGSVSSTLLLCMRPVHVGGYDTQANHWFLSIPTCGTLGYGPQGVITTFGDNSDFPSMPVGVIDCMRIDVSAAQVKCLCDLKRLFMRPLKNIHDPNQRKFVDPWQGCKFNTIKHNCQYFATAVLNHCGLNAPPIQCASDIVAGSIDPFFP